MRPKQRHDPEKLHNFSGQILRLQCYGEIAEAWAAAGPFRFGGLAAAGRDLSPICEASAEG